MKTAFAIIFCSLFGMISVFGQTDVCHRSSVGNDFWFGFMENSVDDSSAMRGFFPCIPDHFGPLHYGEITVTSESGADFNIFIGHSEKPYQTTFHVGPHSSQTVRFNLDLITEAIHLTSTGPVSVYALNFTEYTSDIALIYPTPSLGTDYFAMCYSTPYEIRRFEVPVYWDGYKQDGYVHDPNSEFLIVATTDNTSVMITPTKSTTRGQPAGETFTITLNKGEQYQVASVGYYGDLTGSHILSNHPVALFSGNNWTRVAQVHARSPGHFFEQVPPVQAWGKKFIAVPYMMRWRDTWRILASKDQTIIRIGGNPVDTLKRGDFYPFALNEAALIESNNPILLAQYRGADSEFWGISDDQPSMVIVNPINMVSEKVTFTACEFTPWTTSLTAPCDTSEGWMMWEHGDRVGVVTYFNQKTDTSTCLYFVNVAVSNDAVGKINLDNHPISFLPIGTTGYSFAQLNISRGTHLIESTQQGKGFVAYAYTFWGNDTRSYNICFNQDFTLDLAVTNNLVRGQPNMWCYGDSLRAGDVFDTYKWNTNDTASFTVPQNNGTYGVEVSTRDGCVLKDNIQLQIDRPVVNLDPQRYLCGEDSVILDAGSDFDSFQWSTTEQTQKITVWQPGNYDVMATDSLGCNAKADVKVIQVEKPRFDFSAFNGSICGRDGILDIKADSSNFSVERLSDNMTFTSLTVDAPDYNTYPFRIRATDNHACFSDTTIQASFHKIPDVDFSIDSTTCFGYNLNVSYIGDANKDLSRFAWIFRGDTVINAVGADSVSVPLGTKKVRQDLKLTVTRDGCSNSKTISNIKVVPMLSMGTDNNSGCKPFTTQFNAFNSEPVSYTWDFGDGGSLSGTPAPSHTFKDNGYYTIKLKVVSNQGCVNEVKQDSMIYIPPNPLAQFTMNDETLPNFQHQVSFFNQSTGAVTYLWDFGDEISTQEFNPTHLYSKYGYRTIILHAINEYSCEDSTSQNIVVEFKKLFPPNAFSPVAPETINREFKLTTEGITSEGYHLMILSRWNDIVFESKNEIKGWDGRMLNGNLAPGGNYVWVLDFSDILGKRHHQTGTVTLVY